MTLVRFRPSCVFICSFTNLCSLTLLPEVTVHLRNSTLPETGSPGLGKIIWDVYLVDVLLTVGYALNPWCWMGGRTCHWRGCWGACIWEAWEDASAEFILLVAIMVLRFIRFLTSRSSGVGMSSHHISPMSTRLTNSHGFLVGLVASELNRSNNLLFMVLPSTSQSEGHSSVTLLGDRRVLGNIWCIGAGNPNSRPLRDANSASSKVHGGVCKIRCITWYGALYGCLEVKYDSCNSLLSSFRTKSVIHSASVSVWKLKYTKFLLFLSSRVDSKVDPFRSLVEY